MPYVAEGVYGIIADVAAYPQFVPLCHGARLWDHKIQDGDREQFKAELLIIYPKLSLRERFVSEVTCNPKALTVRSISNRPPVKTLENRWRVVPAGEAGCDVQFYVDYEMSSRLLQMALKNAFDYAVRRIMTAFEERARQVIAAPVQE
jgi:coenzyme Q-binding protein COQ10